MPASHIWKAGQEHRNGSVTYICTACGMEKKVESASGGFSGMILLFVLLALVCAGGIAALVIIMRRKEKEAVWETQEESDDTVSEFEDMDS